MEDSVLNQILSKVESIDRKVKEIDRKTDVTNVRLDSLDTRVDMLAVEVIGVKERMDTFATKDDLRSFKDEVVGTVVDFGKRLERAEQEFLMTYPRFDRIERHVVLSA
ncbi:hypothetical protein A2856_00930 [Candidatus Uhrbacteria bacterium RIFCSPHIGHO2_01_FULL_63_20]|uniref:Uncharacterized protein n=1 Tax=Candidatus Uhrbacteria bacterium RIFCSPHIGHO2_01_FULL_63_20 TaxID=1802385 RepID=A0A1F7TM38_9BACT|nr:MAG: hypothetical protein A2856_00930 [Candidatus Uhrbacteria bacterium RIFCSPHIGHO2_01_FULL_63_20]